MNCLTICGIINLILAKKRGKDMWVVRKMYWRSGQQYVQAQKIFENREAANAFRKELDFATELYETNLVVSNKGEF